MTASLLEQLRKISVVVADTGEIEAIRTYRPRDATTNPTLLAKASAMPEYARIVDDTLSSARRDAPPGASGDEIVTAAFERLAVAFGLEILDIIPGRVSTEVDARLSFDTAGTIAKAREIVGGYEAAGASRERVLIKIASTWEGIRAAQALEKEGIRCNLTLLFGFHQAVACADAGATLISPFVGRILDWFVANTDRKSYPPEEDPGVRSVTRIYNYFKAHGYRTEVMGASFRNIGQITGLAGCDLLTISPALLKELDETRGELPRRLEPARAAAEPRIAVDRAAFERMHAADRMASDKLAEGIRGFTTALEELEKLLRSRLADQGG